MSSGQEAPGDLEIVRAFLNTRDLEDGTERLDGPAAVQGWLSEHGLLDTGHPVDRAEVERLRAVREALRDLVSLRDDGDRRSAEAAARLDAAAERAQVRLRVDPHGTLRTVPATGGVDGAVGRLLAIVASAQQEGTWERLKVCPADDCRWAFYDHSRNRSAKWCTMAECGNRAKVRAYRERRRPGA